MNLETLNVSSYCVSFHISDRFHASSSVSAAIDFYFIVPRVTLPCRPPLVIEFNFLVPPVTLRLRSLLLFDFRVSPVRFISALSLTLVILLLLPLRLLVGGLGRGAVLEREHLQQLLRLHRRQRAILRADQRLEI